MEKIAVYEFEPNRCVVSVKTFNSWHCVRPMRSTLTTNIELEH